MKRGRYVIPFSELRMSDVDSVGGRHEAHHGGFTDDRRHLWVAGLDDSKIFIFDVASDPANPRLVKTIDDFVEASGPDYMVEELERFRAGLAEVPAHARR